MIRIKDYKWQIPLDKMQVNNNQISAVYAGAQKIYPMDFCLEYISGLTLNGKTYLPPAKLVIPGAEANNAGIYIETVTPDQYTLITGGKYTDSLNFVTFWGIYKVAEGIKPTAKTVEKTGKTAAFKTGSWTFERYNGEEIITETIPYVGETYYDIVKPVITRYMLVSGWINGKYTSVLPSWMNFSEYEEIPSARQNVRNYRANANVLLSMALCGNAAPELFLQGIKIPSGATIITGGFSSTNSSYDLVGSTFSPSELTTIGQAAGIVENTTLPSGTPCTFVNGALPNNRNYGCIGSIFKFGDSGGLETFTNSAAYAGISTIKTNGTIVSGSTSSGRAGMLYTTIDNVITELITEENFLWYKGTYIES